MKLTVIGYWGGYPAKGEASSVYILEKDGFLLVLDFGSGALSLFPKYRHVLDIDAIMISHYHADHIADIGVLQHAILVQSLLSETDRVIPIYGHTENSIEFEKLNHDYTEAKEYLPDDVLNVGPFFIRFLRTSHAVPCFGMRITDGKKTLVYTADSAYQDEWIPFCLNADVLISDCNFYAGQDAKKAGHMTSVEAATIAKKANIKPLVLSHLPHFGEHERLMKEASEIYDGKITLAYEGLEWE